MNSQMERTFYPINIVHYKITMVKSTSTNLHLDLSHTNRIEALMSDLLVIIGRLQLICVSGSNHTTCSVFLQGRRRMIDSLSIFTPV